MTPERQAELRRLLMPQQPRCRHARDGQDTCGPDVHNLHCSWPACAEPKVLSRDEHEQAMRTALTEALDAVANREREIEALIAAMASDEGDAQAVLRLAIELASVEGPLSPSIRRLLKHLRQSR